MQTLLDKQRAFFAQGVTRPTAERRRCLEALVDALETRADRLLAALYEDLGKPAHEAYAAEVGFVLRDARHALRCLNRWVRPRREHVPAMLRPARARVSPQPLGVTLILGPWNYPLQLLFSPMVSALAAGNCVCLKPSEFAPATAREVVALCRAAFPEELVSVVCGEADVARQLVGLPFDHIFFTGSSSVGRRVMAAAAEHLTPVTLELGGKCPCVVCEDIDGPLAARRIMWGKCLNAGQTCVAPDYLLVRRKALDPLLEALERAADRFVPPLDGGIDGAYARIVNRRQFDRLLALMTQGTRVAGGEHDAERLFMRPALLTRVPDDAPLMQEEIFGPLLPVRPYDTFEEALAFIEDRPSPLAAYLFTGDRKKRRVFGDRVRAGGMTINDTIGHILPAGLPFGGVGASGMGRYHGQAGFETFSQARSTLERGTWIDPGFRYPPIRMPLEWLRKGYRYLMA